MKGLLRIIPILIVLPNIISAQVSFQSSGQQLNQLAGRGVLLSDFNSDGNLDAFVVNEDGPEGNGYRVYFGDSTGQFTDSGQRLVDPNGVSGMVDKGDINGDDRLELITGKTIWLHDENGNFSVDANAFTGSDNAGFGQCKLADLNGDNYLDVFANVFGDVDVKGRVYLNNGHGQFIDTGQRLGRGSQAAVELGDLNNDGHIDAVITGWRENPSDPCPNRVWLNDGNGNFSETGQVLDEVMRHVHGQALGDIDNDGDKDLIFSIQTSAPYARVYRNDGTGHFTASQSCGSRSAEKVKLGDMDGDGDLDMVLACNGPNEVWLNNSSGTFTNSGLRLGSEWSWGIDVGDLNGDGKLDIFAVNMAFDMLTGPPYYIARGRLAEVWLNTTPITSAEDSETKIPNGFQLLQNYPNPFNPSTVIAYKLPMAGNVKLSIYNLLGQKIKTLVDLFQNADEHSIVWNGTDDSNNEVGSGIYFYKMETSGMNLQKKMVLVR